VFVHDSCGGSVDAVVVLASGDELSDGSTCGFLHGDAFGVGTCAECGLFAVGEAESHGHATMVSVRYRPYLPIGASFGAGFAINVNGVHATDSLDASVQLPVGVTITKIAVMVGNDSGGPTGIGDTVTLHRRTLGSDVTVATVSSVGVDAGTSNLPVTLVTPEVETSGRYYSLRYVSQGVGFERRRVRRGGLFTTAE
jgi:hypothetical protein